MSSAILETPRLLIRPFVAGDLLEIHRILTQAFGDDSPVPAESDLRECRSWLEWSILSQEWFPRMHQPPYGDRAIVLKAGGALVGAVGYTPLLDVYGQIPVLSSIYVEGFNVPEFGLFWAIDPTHQRRGYATEAARAMVEHAFTELRLKRILATTEYENLASQAVMCKLGMRLERNPQPEPPWLQVVGILENKAGTG